MTVEKIKAAVREWATAHPRLNIRYDLGSEPLAEEVRWKISLLARFGADRWQRYYDESPRETADQIRQLKQRLHDLSSYLAGNSLCEHAVFALIKSGAVAQDDHDLSDMLSAIEAWERCASAALSLVEGEIKRGRPAKQRAWAISWETGRLFTVLTGRKPGTAYSETGTGARRHGPFVDLLAAIFNALDVDASAQSMSTHLVDRM